MSTTAWRIVQLVKSLPAGEQRAVRDFLAQTESVPASDPRKNPEDWEAEQGLPDDDPFFKIMEEVEHSRQKHLPRPSPDLE